MEVYPLFKYFILKNWVEYVSKFNILSHKIFSAILDFLFVKTTSIAGKTRNVLASRNTDNDACAPHNIKAAFLHFSPQKLGIGDWSRTYNWQLSHTFKKSQHSIFYLFFKKWNWFVLAKIHLWLILNMVGDLPRQKFQIYRD